MNIEKLNELVKLREVLYQALNEFSRASKVDAVSIRYSGHGYSEHTTGPLLAAAKEAVTNAAREKVVDAVTSLRRAGVEITVEEALK